MTDVVAETGEARTTGSEMEVQPEKRNSEKRSPLWGFEEVKTIRQHLLHRAGRLTRPGGKLRLTMSGNEATKRTFQDYLKALGAVA